MFKQTHNTIGKSYKFRISKVAQYILIFNKKIISIIICKNNFKLY
jgi:hypothetical protein